MRKKKSKNFQIFVKDFLKDFILNFEITPKYHVLQRPAHFWFHSAQFSLFSNNIENLSKKKVNSLKFEKWSYQLHLAWKQTKSSKKLSFWASLSVFGLFKPKLHCLKQTSYFWLPTKRVSRKTGFWTLKIKFGVELKMELQMVELGTTLPRTRILKYWRF